MRRTAWAKINLTLHVTGRRDHQVVGIRRPQDRGEGPCDFQGNLRPRRDLEPVADTGEDDQAVDLVGAVVAATGDVEGQVDLGPGGAPHDALIRPQRVHRLIPRSGDNDS